MSDVLQRLVDRALGESVGSLRPRRPSRFEAAPGETGFQEIHAEAPAAVLPPAREAPEAVSFKTPPRTPPRRNVAGPRAPEPSQEQGPIDRPSPQPTPGSGPPAAAGGVQGPPSSPRAPGGPVPNAMPLPDPAALRPSTPSRAAPAPDRSVAAPDPLLPAAGPVHLEAGPEYGPEASAPGTPAMPARDHPGQPEITIHIGQLDVRAEPARTSRPAPREPRRRSLPGLSDYLRGGRS